MKQWFKKIIPPVVLDYISKIKYSKNNSRFKGYETNQVFTEIYTKNLWGNSESRSGVGSSLENTQTIIPAINQIIDQLNITSLLDIPCGDFNWIKEVNLDNVSYLGCDIVDALIKENKLNHETDNIRFVRKDLIRESLPVSDLVLIRDCWVHFSFDDIYQSIENICSSRSNYLMVTTFSKHTLNHDIVTGDWRPLNLQKPPFNFPEPLLLIEEKYDSQFIKEAKGKTLGVWRISDLKG